MRAEDKASWKLLLIDTVRLFCQNGLQYKSKVKIDGLIVVTIDDADVIVTNLSRLHRGENDVVFVQKTSENATAATMQTVQAIVSPGANSHEAVVQRVVVPGMITPKCTASSSSVVTSKMVTGVMTHAATSVVASSGPSVIPTLPSAVSPAVRLPLHTTSGTCPPPYAAATALSTVAHPLPVAAILPSSSYAAAAPSPLLPTVSSVGHSMQSLLSKPSALVADSIKTASIRVHISNGIVTVDESPPVEPNTVESRLCQQPNDIEITYTEKLPLTGVKKESAKRRMVAKKSTAAKRQKSAMKSVSQTPVTTPIDVSLPGMAGPSQSADAILASNSASSVDTTASSKPGNVAPPPHVITAPCSTSHSTKVTSSAVIQSVAPINISPICNDDADMVNAQPINIAPSDICNDKAVAALSTAATIAPQPINIVPSDPIATQAGVGLVAPPQPITITPSGPESATGQTTVVVVRQPPTFTASSMVVPPPIAIAPALITSMASSRMNVIPSTVTGGRQLLNMSALSSGSVPTSTAKQMIAVFTPHRTTNAQTPHTVTLLKSASSRDAIVLPSGVSLLRASAPVTKQLELQSRTAKKLAPAKQVSKQSKTSKAHTPAKPSVEFAKKTVHIAKQSESAKPQSVAKPSESAKLPVLGKLLATNQSQLTAVSILQADITKQPAVVNQALSTTNPTLSTTHLAPNGSSVTQNAVDEDDFDDDSPDIPSDNSSDGDPDYVVKKVKRNSVPPRVRTPRKVESKVEPVPPSAPLRKRKPRLSRMSDEVPNDTSNQPQNCGQCSACLRTEDCMICSYCMEKLVPTSDLGTVQPARTCKERQCTARDMKLSYQKEDGQPT